MSFSTKVANEAEVFALSLHLSQHAGFPRSVQLLKHSWSVHTLPGLQQDGARRIVAQGEGDAGVDEGYTFQDLAGSLQLVGSVGRLLPNWQVVEQLVHGHRCTNTRSLNVSL